MNEILQNFTYMEQRRKLNRSNMGHTLRSKVGLPSAWPPCSRRRPVHSYSPAEPTESYCRRGWSTCLWCTPAQTHPLPGTATCTGSSGRRPRPAESACNRYTCVKNVPKLRGRSLTCTVYIRKISKQSWSQIWILDTVPKLFLKSPLL